jgi:hypothetical protein
MKELGNSLPSFLSVGIFWKVNGKEYIKTSLRPWRLW